MQEINAGLNTIQEIDDEINGKPPNDRTELRYSENDQAHVHGILRPYEAKGLEKQVERG